MNSLFSVVQDKKKEEESSIDKFKLPSNYCHCQSKKIPLPL